MVAYISWRLRWDARADISRDDMPMYPARFAATRLNDVFICRIITLLYGEIWDFYILLPYYVPYFYFKNRQSCLANIAFELMVLIEAEK